jgi:hypothetical protein
MPEVLREGGRPKKLLTLVREAIRRRHLSSRMEESYANGIEDPEARYSSMSWTLIRVPRRVGSPLRTAGSMRTRSR